MLAESDDHHTMPLGDPAEQGDERGDPARRIVPVDPSGNDDQNVQDGQAGSSHRTRRAKVSRLGHGWIGGERVRILALPRFDRVGASSRYRFYQFLPELREAGHTVDIRPLWSKRYLRSRYAGMTGRAVMFGVVGMLRRLDALRRAGGYDLVWIEKEALPWVPAPIEAALMRRCRAWVVDFDDAQFHRYDQHRNPLIRRLLGGKIPALLPDAAGVVAGNDYLEEWAREHGGSPVAQVPTVVDVRRYPLTNGRRRQERPFTIAWIGTPPTTAHLTLRQPLFERLIRDRGWRMVAIGACRRTLRDSSIIVRTWREHEEAAALTRCDVGVMPLPDAPWERGKCGLKLLQYMAAGLPVVASPVGVNQRVVRHGVNGLLADTEAEWEAALLRLEADPALRADMGKAGRAKVEAEYDHAVAVPRLEAALDLGLRR